MMYNANLTMNPMIEDYNATVKALSVTQKQGFIDYKDFKDIKLGSRLISQRKQSNRLLKNASVNYLKLIESINPSFKSDKVFIPRRTLTNPREPSKNLGHDNINDDYILRVNDILGDIEKYEILDLMGHGTFGQVVKCRALRTGNLVAVKVIKQQPAFIMQGDKEINILMMLRDRPEKHRFLQLIDHFMFRGHTCVVFELLSISLHGLFSQQITKPHMSIEDIQQISINVLETLSLLKDMHIIHTDLKPDNILMKSIDNIHDVKLIDYGSALLETEKLNYCVQTAFYRSPEVILHVEFGCAIDMWSFGCFVVEMFLGRPLFPSGNEASLLHMMVSTLGCLPPENMLKRGRDSNKFFYVQGSGNSAQTKLKELNHNAHDLTFAKSTLKDKIMGFASNDDSSEEDSDIDNYAEMKKREQLYDFVKGILVFEPLDRKTPAEALQHPFIASAVNATPKTPEVAINLTKSQQPSIPTTIPNVLFPLSPVAIFESLSNAMNNNSSINTSRTTEDSLDPKTPPLSSIYNRSKERLLLTPSKSPKIIITSTESSVSPPLITSSKKPPKHITKKVNPENTLDSQVKSLFPQPSKPDSTFSDASDPYDNIVAAAAAAAIKQQQQQYYQNLYNTVTSVPLQQQMQFAALASPAVQNYQQQQQQLVNNMFQHMTQQQQQTYMTSAPLSPLLYQQQQMQHALPQTQNYSSQMQQQQQLAYPHRHFSPLQ
ncbi:unnamed protein product [Mucor hiemalis]